jgi:DnaJ-class molecular chaperone
VSAAERKGTYDLYGEEVLKHGKADENGIRKGGIYEFKPSACNQIFNSFFGTSNPFEALEGV